MKKMINKISQVLQIVLLAPVKLPQKVLTALKYLALSMGIIEKVLTEEESQKVQEKEHENNE